MIFGNSPWSPSGYGTQAWQLGRTLRKHGHEVAFAAYWGLHGTSISFDGFPVYPGSGEDAYARDVLPGHYRHFGADLLITLLDIWVFEPEHLAGMHVAHWMPVDCVPVSGLDRKTLTAGGRPVAFSRFGQAQLAEAGFEPLYAPHALDMAVWAPLEDREKAREQLGFTGKFVIGMNAANQDPERKGYFEQLSAFARFAERHDDARMLIHTRKNTQHGVDIDQMIASLGLQDKAVPGDQYAIAAGMISDGQMVSWHGIMDLLSNCSYGEGFGLAVLQSQATGIPVVVTDFSAMSELCGAGWKVKGQEKWNRGHNARWLVPSIAAIDAAYEKAWQHRGDQAMRDKARKFALRYDADAVYLKYWVPVLAELEERRRSGQVVQAAGLKWRVGDDVDHGDRLGPQHEESVEDAVLDLLPEGGVFLDVGAHVGHYALRAAAKASQVLAVECNPATAGRLRENLDLNEITNVAIHQVAAWDKVERLRMDSRDGHQRSGDTRVSADGDGTVTGMPLDRILASDRRLKDAGRLDLVKLDVEGADLHALRGMRKTLGKYRPVMVIEDHSVYGYYDKADLEALLKDLGYTVRELAMYGCAPYLLAEPVPA